MTDAATVKTIIAEDIEIEGTIKCASDIQFDGKLTGNLDCTGNAIIGNKSVIKGNITVKSVTVMGKVDGNISASDRIQLKSSTRLTGDISAKRLTVEDGVTFIGKSEVNPTGTVMPKAPIAPSVADITTPAAITDADKSKSNTFVKK